MSVYNNYTNADILAGKLAKNSAANGGVQKTAIAVFTVAAGDDAGSIYRVFPNMAGEIVVKSVRIHNAAITGANDWDITLRKSLSFDGVGASIHTDTPEIGNALDLSAGNPVSAAPVFADNAIALGDRGKALWELAGETIVARTPAYDICLIMNAKTTTATGAVVVYLDYVQL